MKIRAALSIAVVISAMTGPASALEINGPNIGCRTDAAYSEIQSAIGDDDQRHANAILEAKQCVVLDGQEFAIVDRGLFRSEIRVYAGGSSVVLFVSSDVIAQAK